MKDPTLIIKSPVITEKGTRLKEKGQYVFEVDPDSNKLEIKKAIETLFKVKVMKVRTMHVLGKVKRYRFREGKRPNWKKAIATLKSGDHIEFFEGV